MSWATRKDLAGHMWPAAARWTHLAGAVVLYHASGVGRQ